MILPNYILFAIIILSQNVCQPRPIFMYFWLFQTNLSIQ